MQQFISDYIGLCNKLETLLFAYAIREKHGHQINLDWPELNSFDVLGTRRRPMRWYHRFSNLKMRECSEELFQTLGQYRNLNLRAFSGGPPPLLDQQVPRVLQDIRLKPKLVEAIQNLFSTYQDVPVVGVHLRRGDFLDVQPDVYDAVTHRHPAVPGWWFIWAMEQIRQARPDVRFYLSYTGSLEAYAEIIERFDCIYLDVPNPYTYKGALHGSTSDPVAELFALSCCSVILATPISSFSHWATNMLGKPSVALMAPSVTHKSDPAMVKAVLWGQRLPSWLRASRAGEGTEAVVGAQSLPVLVPPNTKWLDASV